MDAASPYSDLFYTASGLDRAHQRRRDDGWIEDALRSRKARILPVWRNQNLVLETGEAEDWSVLPLEITGDHARGVLQIAGEVVFLGLKDDTPYFAVDLSEHELPTLTPIMRNGSFTDLRSVARVLAADDAARLAHARGIMFWHRRHQFCGVCGAETASHHGGSLRICRGPDCGLEHHPRTDPAVIMLITRPGPEGGAALLARKSEWPEGMYAVLAGFLEPGESLEECVIRETDEEVGIEASDVVYRGSQPWPFPSSLMIAFRATAKTVRISVDKDELEDARWFTRAQIRDFPNKGLRLPRADSISRHLIDEWMAEADG